MQEEKLISEKTHIRCKIIVEILGKPKEHVEKTIRMYVDKVKNDSDVIVLKTDFSKAEEKEKLGGQALQVFFCPHIFFSPWTCYI